MNMIELLNKVRSEASDTYKKLVPEATAENMEQIRYAMLGDNNVAVANEFISTIMNKFVKPILIEKRFTNPLSPLKKGAKPLGDTIEEIYANFIKADQDAFNGQKLFERAMPDINTVYHRMNKEIQIPVTIDRVRLTKAFTNYLTLESFIVNIINSAYNTADLIEFNDMKNLFKSAYEKNAIKSVTVKDPLASKENAIAFVKAVKNVSSLMKYPSTQFNAYLEAQNVDKEANMTFSRYDEQVLILPETVNNGVDIDVLAPIFNMTVAEFNKTRKILIDEFPIAGCVGALVDEQFLQVWDDYFIVTEFFNAKGIYTNYYLNIGQTMAYSILVNGILFMVGEDKDNDSTVETFTVTKSIVEGASLSNNQNNVTEGNSYSTTVKGEFTSVTVAMGGSDITATAFDSETNKIKIDSVTDNVTVTVA